MFLYPRRPRILAGGISGTQIVLLSLSAFLGLNACTEIEKMEPAPIFYSGSVGDTVRTRQFGDRGRTALGKLDA